MDIFGDLENSQIYQYLERLDQKTLEEMCKLQKYKKMCLFLKANRRSVGIEGTNLDVIGSHSIQGILPFIEAFPTYEKAMAFAESLKPGFKYTKEYKVILDYFTEYEKNDYVETWTLGNNKYERYNSPKGDTHKWYKNDLLNRDNDLPATIHSDGTQEWYKNGKLHREGDLPAVIYPSGTQKWFKNDQLHREGDLPAAIYSNGSEEWFKDGQRHREGDLPAVIYPDGTREWYKNGKIHRENGPAIISPDGTQIWFKNDQRHREEDLPAIIESSGTQMWYKNGKIHRENGPALVFPDGTEQWYKNGVYIKK